MIWAEQAWGSYWSWDPKETWALVTWLTYTLYLHLRFIRGARGKLTALVAVIGFILTMFTFFGVNYLMSGLHSYV
jgi:ABC-type transport system involved in cytochrome c biogenesis permease subunit